MDGNGGCCIARWASEGPVSAGYDMSKMDMIMLKFRPIAPKPASGNGSPGATSDSGNNSPRDGRHAKAPARGRRKSGTTTTTTTTTTKRCNGKKRKSSSPTNRTAESVQDHDDEDQKGGVTLLPLFPEAPDLSPREQQGNNKNMPMWLSFDENTPMFEDSYRLCHAKGW